MTAGGEIQRAEDGATLADAPDGAHADGLRALATVPWLRDCEPSTLRILLRRARLLTVAPGAAVVRRGVRAGHLTVIVSGRVEMSRTTAAGRRLVVSYSGPGQVIGVAAAIDRRGFIHDGVAQGPVRVLTVHGDDLRLAIDTDPVLRWRMLDLLARRARRLHEQLSDTSTMPLPVRLARALLSLHATGDAATPGEGRGLRVSQEGLAGMLAVPRQRINGELKALERDGVLRMAYRSIVLLDEAALRARAQEPAD